tara:strand:+ start:468 stop:953 length:486 start_codon:yes stop_codon:yes gene_type:complete
MLKIFLFSLLVVLFQLISSELLAINQISPDFLLIYVLYTTLIFGRFKGVIIAFSLGFISDLFGIGSYFALHPLLLSTASYAVSFLIGRYEKMLPYIFYSYWIVIILLYFFIMAYFRFHVLFLSNFTGFLIQSIYLFLYTFTFVFILQFFYSIEQASHAQDS